MQGGPARGQQQPPSESAPGSAEAEWYAVTSDGASALRLAPGLTLGESEAGALLLNDRDPGNQWVEFNLDEEGKPSLAIITRDRSLLVGGDRRMRHHLDVGVRVRLPGNTLYISRGIRLPATSGPVVEVVPREVPARPDDIVGGGIAEALEFVRAADPHPSPGPRAAVSATRAEATWVRVPVEDDATAKLDEAGPVPGEARTTAPEAPRAPPSRGAATHARPAAVAEPGRRRAARRHQRSRNTPMLAAASAVVVLAALAGGLVAMGWLDGDEVALSETALEVFDSPAAEQPYGEGGEGDDAPGGDSPGLAEEDADVSPAAPAEVARNGAETSRPTGPPSEEESPPAAPDSGTAERELRGEAPPPDWRLTRARTLMDAGYITHPPEDNAVAYLERLLAADPGNPRAMAMLDEASTRLIEAAVRAHDQGLDYEARNTLEEVFGFDPADERAHRLWQEWVGAER